MADVSLFLVDTIVGPLSPPKLEKSWMVSSPLDQNSNLSVPIPADISCIPLPPSNNKPSTMREVRMVKSPKVQSSNGETRNEEEDDIVILDDSGSSSSKKRKSREVRFEGRGLEVTKE